MEKERTKLCSNCEGSVPLSADYCPYCGDDLSMPTERGEPDGESSFKPLYMESELAESSWETNPAQEDKKEAKTRLKQKSILLTIILLTAGGYLFALGLLIFFFSENGKLILEWKSRYSLLYCLIAAPFLYIGWLRLRNE